MADSKMIRGEGLSKQQTMYSPHTALPVELLHLVAEFLLDDVSSLSKLTETCRHIYNVVLPVLNRNELSFRSMLSRQIHIPRYVESLSLHLHPPTETESQHHLFIDFVPLLVAFDRLKALTIKGYAFDRPGNSNGQVLFHDLFRRCAQETIMPRLETLRLNLADYSVWRCDIDALFCHPGLRTIALLGADIRCCRTGLPNRSHPLDRLTLLSCYVTPAVLATVLSAPQALRYFTHKGVPLFGRARSFPQDAAAYIVALDQQEVTLEYLDFDVPHRGIFDAESPLDLRNFTALNALTIRSEVLHGEQAFSLPLDESVLPPSLHHLVIWTAPRIGLARDYILANAHAELKRRVERGDLPSLHTLVFEAPFPPFDQDRGLQRAVNAVWRELAQVRPFPFSCSCCYYRVCPPSGSV